MTSEQRSCLGKVRHNSQHRACTALTGTLAKFHLERGVLQVYQCRFCHGWHIGHVKITPNPIRRLPRSK